MKRALITGIAGQDGYYLSSQLLKAGMEVHGVDLAPATGLRNTSNWAIEYDAEGVVLHYNSLNTPGSVRNLLGNIKPDVCYHLAAQSFVGTERQQDCTLIDNNVRTTCWLLAAVDEIVPECRVFYAATSEMFGNAASNVQNETTPLVPRNAYGVSKAAGYHLARMYRQRGLFVSCGILYNHESPRRNPRFVTRKVTRAVAHIANGSASELYLGALDVRRDWGYAPEYVEAMQLMLQHDVPDDYVLATGTLHSVEDLCKVAFSHAGLDWRDHVRIDPAFSRQEDRAVLCGDATKASAVLGWTPRTPFVTVIRMMVDADLAAINSGLH